MANSGDRNSVFSDNYSKGCQACAEGRWLCIFLTYLCGGKCHFCPAPSRDDRVISAFGTELEEIYSYVICGDYSGISFSGGDPFLVFDRLMNYLLFFKQRIPDIYYWVYTNGINVSECQLQALSDGGMDEIRFNIAAVGYNDTRVLETIKLAKKYIKYVAVEIPSIPEDQNLLVGLLPKLDALGLDYLNLHEYILVNNYGCQPYVGGYTLNHSQELEYDIRSRHNTALCKRYSVDYGYSFKINDCSLDKKEYQMCKRRLAMGKMFKSSDEYLTNDGLLRLDVSYPGELTMSDLDTIVSIPEELDKFLSYAARSSEISGENNVTNISLLMIPPMEVRGKRVVIEYSII